MTFVHPFDDPDVIAGQGTIGMEILRQAATPVSAIFVAIGGGGLISGIATYVKQVYPEIKIIGVEPVDSNAMKLSLDEGRRVTLSTVGVFADGVAVRQVGAECFRLAQKFVDEVVLVTTDEMCAAIRDVFEDTRSILEPSGALAIAGMKRYVQRTGVTDQTLVAVASGANMNFERLKFVTERAEIGQNKEALFAVTIPERPRHLWSFLHVIGRRSITEFNYRMSNTEMARIFVGVAVSGLDDAVAVRKTFETAGYQTVDLTSNELAKLHVKYMVGGRSELAISERLFRFEFADRPGALLKLLGLVSWNISLFHCHNQGGDVLRVLCGMQVPDENDPRLQQFIDHLPEHGITAIDETLNEAYRTFLVVEK
eukprot:c20005_g1_i7.p1 GENE.c20005_g1_i7~~c20005_g1_i7.p1  ORF type:complete len:369 (+),score=96.49 c20005_g1_i7:2141-3247(+)